MRKTTCATSASVLELSARKGGGERKFSVADDRSNNSVTTANFTAPQRRNTFPPERNPTHTESMRNLLVIIILAGAGYYGWQAYQKSSALPICSTKLPSTTLRNSSSLNRIQTQGKELDSACRGNLRIMSTNLVG